MSASLPTLRRTRLAAGLTVLALTGLLAACGGSTAAVPFDPASPCTADVQQAGAYPALEALLPATLDGKERTTIDSGRTCSSSALGSLGARGVKELRFAGATWKITPTVMTTVAVFEADGLDAAAIVDFYRSGAKQAGKTAESKITDTTVGTSAGVRLDAKDPDGVPLTVVAWPTGTPGRVNVLLADGVDPAKVDATLKSLEGG